MKLRLVKVIVQPFFVVEDDDNNLSELNIEPTVVTAKDWPDYPTCGFAEATGKLEASLADEDHEHALANKDE